MEAHVIHYYNITNHQNRSKASFMLTNGTNWIVGTYAYHGTPYDGHTLIEALSQVTGIEVEEAYCDKGYCLKKGEEPENYRMFLPGGKKRSMSEKK